MSDNDKAPAMAALVAQVKKLQEQCLIQMKADGKAKKGERPTKYWSQLHKKKKPRDIMMALESVCAREVELGSEPRPVYETNSRRMAELARKYHMNLQKDAPEDNRPEMDRDAAIKIALNAVEVQVLDVQAEEFGEEMSWDECKIALRFLVSGSAPGLDRLPYDLWKALHA